MTTQTYAEIVDAAGLSDADEFNAARAITQKLAAGDELTADENAAWKNLGPKWARFGQLLDERERAVQARAQLEANPRAADPNGGVGEALAAIQAGRPRRVIHTMHRVLDPSTGAETIVDDNGNADVTAHRPSAGRTSGLAAIAAGLERGADRHGRY